MTQAKSQKPRIVVGADHGGSAQKDILARDLEAAGYHVADTGCENDGQSYDYPDYAATVARTLVTGDADFGILFCGTGLGMAIAANKVAAVRAVPVTDVRFAQLARRHNDANVLCLSGRFVSIAKNAEIIDAFLTTEYEDGRHQRRLDKIAELEMC